MEDRAIATVVVQRAVLQSLDIVSSILIHLSSPKDVLSAAAVCRVWRMAAMDHAYLRSWTLDDTLDYTPGLKTSSTPLLPKTPPPKQWINPTAHSPLASFKVPKSLLQHDRSIDKTMTLAFNFSNRYPHNAFDEPGLSPRTPSPIREPVKCPPLFDIVKEKMVMGRFLGDIDIMSARINDEVMQLLLTRCPRLHTFRLVNTCAVKLNDSIESFSTCMDSGNLQKTSCNCSPLSNKAFSGVHEYCPELASVTLILQHVTFRKMLQKLLVELGRLPMLHTLCIELRVPSFGQSTKSKVIWESHVRFTEQEIFALIQAGPPPLHALALNRCDLTGASLAALALACPHIEALELHSDFEDTKEHGFLQRGPSNLLGLASLSAAAFGVLLTLENCSFDEWRMPALKRLRLETKDALCVKQLHQLKVACPELESLHLIWSGVYGVKETHIYPFTEDSFLTYSDAVL